MSYWYNSSDDGHVAVRNMYRIKINVNEKEKELCVNLVIYKDYKKVHCQQNIKYKHRCLN